MVTQTFCGNCQVFIPVSRTKHPKLALFQNASSVQSPDLKPIKFSDAEESPVMKSATASTRLDMQCPETHRASEKALSTLSSLGSAMKEEESTSNIAMTSQNLHYSERGSYVNGRPEETVNKLNLQLQDKESELFYTSSPERGFHWHNLLIKLPSQKAIFRGSSTPNTLSTSDHVVHIKGHSAELSHLSDLPSEKTQLQLTYTIESKSVRRRLVQKI
ncbi:hypothetical protein BPOR_0087g00010 [Botrytis porri]|uniref:Uncharacterized protein n=1 Tax=Botrytis porri TaxID=87229 RepID=A0A4Z1KZE9_9HELO|nr:hypothetical protein BPOR_0087g00010 [Botrytis porri]